MATREEYALLSMYVYNVTNEKNRPDVPRGWTRLEYHTDNALGLSYGVFQRSGTGEIVLAYAGSNEKLAADFLGTNLPAGAGVPSWQVPNGALVYQQMRQKYGDNITLTGHSLGGGIASVMAVWFNRPAVTFDEAPFQLTAANFVTWGLVKAQLTLAGYSDPAMDSAWMKVSERESNVTHNYLKGEFLDSLRIDSTAIYGSNSMIASNGPTLSGISLHSQALLTASVMSNAFVEATAKSPNMLERIMDGKLYHFDTQYGTERNFLVDLIRSEQSAVVGQGKLTHFAADLQKLGTNIAGLNKTAQDALIAQGIEWYYWQGADYAGQEFFTQTGESLQYTIALGAGLAGAQNKAAGYAGKWLTPIVNDHGEFYSVSFARDYDQWNITTGTAGVSLTALKSDKSQIFIGAGGGDTFTGGDLDDVMFAGAGADTLNGGGGNDELYGGAENDTLNGGTGYDIYHLEGNDTIEDSDGLGNIKDLAGRHLAGLIIKRVNGSYVFQPDASVGVTGNGADITLTLASGDSVTIKDFGTGKLGLTLYTETVTLTTANLSYTGDFSDPYNIPEIKLYDSSGNDIVTGGGGNDWIRVHNGGSDRLDGGTGNDVITDQRGGDDTLTGGAGLDILYSNEGKDKLYAGAEVTLDEALAAQNDTGTGLKGEYLDGGADDDLLVGSAGNDALMGGRGADLMVAGAGDDDIRGDSETDLNWAGSDWSVTRTTTTGANGVSSYSAVYHNVAFVPTTDGGWTSTYGGATDSVTYTGIGAQDIKGDDIILAGAGADWVYGEYGNDYIDGGAGDDVLFGQDDSDQIFGGDGNDVISGDAGATSLALPGDDYLDGGAGDDKLYGGVGNDQLFGGAGNDTLDGEQGNDYLDGGDGNDTLNGSALDDELFGGAGDDVLQGDSGTGLADGNDYLDGEEGDDTLFGLGGDDRLLGGAGNDQMAGGSGSDDMYGGDGADQMVGDNGGADVSGSADTMYGEAGNDVMEGQGGDDMMDGGADNDLVIGGAGNDQLAGGIGDDQLQGGEGNDALDGGDGSNSLLGQDGNDTLQGGAGNDSLLGGLGDDNLAGGEGDDVYYYTRGDGTDRITDSGGNDRLVLSDITWQELVLGTGSLKLSFTGGEIHLDDFDPDNPFAAGGIEYFQFAGGEVMTRSQLINALGMHPTGTAGADTLTGTALSETIEALAGDDVVTARAGNDIVYGGAGDDVLFGDVGEDTLYGDEGNDILDGGPGNDNLFGGAGDDVLTPGTGFNVMEGGAGNDTYLFDLDLGEVLIHEYDSTSVNIDTIQLASGTVPGDVWVYRFMDKLGLVTDGTAHYSNGSFTGNIQILGWFRGETDEIVNEAGLIERVTFADGTVWDPAELNTLARRPSEWDNYIVMTAGDDVLDGLGGSDWLWGLTGADTLIGGGGNDQLDGGDGNDNLDGGADNDYLLGQAGADMLDGGTGNDHLEGGIGNDIYLFGPGSGSDDVLDDDGFVGNVDTVRMAAGVMPSDVVLTRDLKNLYLSLNGGADRLKLTNWYLTENYKVERVAFADGTVWEVADLFAHLSVQFDEGNNHVNGTDGDDMFDGLGGDDEIHGKSGDDLLIGGLGNDMLFGDSGNDTLDGGPGNDYLDGGIGNDTYLFGFGGGRNYATDYDLTPGNVDTISMSSGVTPADLTVTRDKFNLYLGLNNGADLMQLDSWFSDQASKFEQVVFADGTVWGIAELQALANTPTDGNNYLEGTQGGDVLNGMGGIDQLHGLGGADMLYGGPGADSLYGEAGADTLDGGADNDYLNGATGNDTYLFGPGSGQDTIADFDATSGNIDTVQLASGVVPADLAVTRDTYNLYLSLNGGTDRLTLASWFSTGYAIERLVFVDGTVWDAAALLAATLVVPVVTPPAGADKTITTNEDVGYSLSAADFGFSSTNVGSSLSAVRIASLPVAGSLKLAGSAVTANQVISVVDLAAGNFVFSPATNANGSGYAAFTFAVKDQNGVFDVTPNTISFNVTPVNDAPTLAAALADQAATGDSIWTYTVPASTFADVDNGDQLAYRATLADGTALPSWLSFNAASQTFTGLVPNTAAGTIDIQVVATDRSGFSASDVLTLAISPSINEAPLAVADGVSVSEDGMLSATGNALVNDIDPEGRALRVTNPGNIAGALGTLTLGSNGAYSYSLNNAATIVQSLAAGVIATDRFAYIASDDAPFGAATGESEIVVTVVGCNDAPILNAALADQTAAANTNWAWALPAGSFNDVDSGDSLTYRANLVDGTALPSWLSFNAGTQSFIGTVPSAATGSINIQVAATDRASTSASDVFTLAFGKSTGGGVGGNGGSSNGVGSKGNEGVGNGVDAPPPGQTVSFNDGVGTSPGNPGAKGGVTMKATGMNELSGTTSALQTTGAPSVDLSTVSSYLGINDWAKYGTLQDAASVGRADAASVFARWLAMDLAVSSALANAAGGRQMGVAGGGVDVSLLNQAGNGFLGSTTSFGKDTLSLLASSGNNLSTFRGLGNGVQNIA